MNRAPTSRGELHHTIKNNYIMMNRACFLKNANLHENIDIRAPSDLLKSNYLRMKPLVFVSLLFLSLLSLPALAQEQQVVVPYTLADRDRAILTEAKISALDVRFESIDKQFMYQQKQIDDIKTLFYWGFGILITLFIFMLGYMIWDRRTAMKPALEQASKAEENSRNLLTTLREYSKKHPDLAEILRTHGML